MARASKGHCEAFVLESSGTGPPEPLRQLFRSPEARAATYRMMPRARAPNPASLFSPSSGRSRPPSSTLPVGGCHSASTLRDVATTLPRSRNESPDMKACVADPRRTRLSRIYRCLSPQPAVTLNPCVAADKPSVVVLSCVSCCLNRPRTLSALSDHPSDHHPEPCALSRLCSLPIRVPLTYAPRVGRVSAERRLYV